VTAAVKRRQDPGQVIRYLAVGAWNTGFGFALYSAFTALLSQRMRYGYVVASILANLISITVSFLGYKWIVFKTKGNYLRGWLKCLTVYSASMVIGAVALLPLVGVVKRVTHDSRYSPYIAGILLTGFTVIFSFFGHKHISFAERMTEEIATVEAESAHEG
jgi:putative flippase GtrA